jgi:hypothetical protein
LTSHQEDAEPLAVLFAKNFIENQRQSDLNIAKEFGKAFDISLPAVLTAAIMESSDFEDIIRNVIRMRNEAQRFRGIMQKLDDSQASAGEMRDAISDLERESKALGLALDAAGVLGNIGGYVIIKQIIDVLKFANNLAPPKKNFVRRLKQSNPRSRLLVPKINQVFKNSSFEVDANEVLECINTFFDPVL